MDADLQHPPETVPQMLQALDENEYVLGTRYGKGTKIAEGWPLHRRIISSGARLLARPLTPLSDPMSGFFGLKREVLDRGMKKINPVGFKIAMECYVKCGVSAHAEVPINFGTRLHGESKLTGKVIFGYLQHLRALYWYNMFYFLIVLFMIICSVFGYWSIAWCIRKKPKKLTVANCV
eukprot:NODE_1153_length_656_cov_300.726079_g1144_i0.p1 GENE.NODE_1153_length_656_cov_300.726079_g1144_i0~~NODE_1153_length_656_cov_300.726079_g1144_i0.p1  ORF type:complete len:197 (+),score=22.04 NODE_1153_length_656_cov_300.726079_g1144_i0:60-593(+)